MSGMVVVEARGRGVGWVRISNFIPFRWQRRLAGRYYTAGVVIFAKCNLLKNFPTLV